MYHNFSCLALILLTACATVKPPLSPDKLYRRDIVIRSDEGAREGVFVAEKRPAYRFILQPAGEVDLFVVQSCAREEVLYGPFKTGIFQRKEIVFNYLPTPLESTTYCPLMISGFNKTNGQHAWGMIDFMNEDLDDLPVKVSCNGVTEEAKGVAICQMRAGLQIGLSFATPAIYEQEGSCDLGFRDGKEILTSLPTGLCVHVFMEKEVPFRTFRLTTIGYSDLVVREAK